jgi:hypothetical protein
LTDAGPSGRAGRAAGDLLVALALAAAPLAAALAGSSGAVRRLLTDAPLQVRLNLGPGDGLYITGFHPEYEIKDRVATHWTTYQAEIRLPVAVEGPVELSYRFDRVHVQTAEVQVSFGREPVDTFIRGGGGFQIRSATILAREARPVDVGIRVDSHERKNQGLMLDWIGLDLGREGRARLIGAAAVRPALLAALLFAILRWAGWSRRAAAGLTAPVSLTAVLGLLADPWLTHRLLTDLPEALALAGVLGVGLGRALVRTGRVSAEALRTLAAVAAGALLVRGLAVNHPDFYYPDLRTHAKLVAVVRDAGLDFLGTPSRYIWEHGVWRTEAYGRTYAFPYTPAFHVPFAILPIGYDRLLTAMKLAAVALSVVPLALTWALARRLGIAPVGALLLALIPTYTSRLAYAFLPALLGHAADLLLLLWISHNLDRAGERSTWTTGALLVAASQLAYVAGVVNIPVLMAVLAATTAVSPAAGRWRRFAGVWVMTAGGSLLAVALYYRDFLGMAWDVAARLLRGDEGAVSQHPVRGWLEVVAERTTSPELIGPGFLAVAVIGVGLLLSRPTSRRLVAAWLAAYFLLLLGRGRLPDVFSHGHDELLIAPLVGLAAGECVSRLWRAAVWGRLAAAAIVLALGALGLVDQWGALAAQLGHAR